MNERIKKLRKALDLTQQEFASRIGSVQNTITGYETGRRVPSNQVITLICKTFNVNETWLRNGEGEMFLRVESDEELLQMVESIANDDLIKRIIRSYLKLNAPGKAALQKLIDSFLPEEISQPLPSEKSAIEQEPNKPPDGSEGMTTEQLEALYAEQHKKTASGSA